MSPKMNTDNQFSLKEGLIRNVISRCMFFFIIDLKVSVFIHVVLMYMFLN